MPALTIGADEDREPRIKQAVRECASQLDKLTSVVATLEDRLAPVRLRGPIDERADQPTEPVPAASPLAVDIASYTESIMQLGRRLSIVLEELEI